MRRRLVVAFVTLTVMVVTLYGVPRAFIRADQIQEREQEQVEKSAELLAALVGSEEDSGRPVTDDLLSSVLRVGERVEYVASDGSTVVAGGPPGREVAVTSTAQVPGGGLLTLDYSEEAMDERVRNALLPLLLIGLLLVVLAWFAARVLARRLAAPFQELAGHAQSLGSGRFDLDVPHYDIPEAEAVGRALVTSARDLDVLVRRERDFAVTASHELRTPLTAARLRLEDLAMWESTPVEVAAELGEALVELARLDTAVAHLLEHDREGRSAAGVEVDIAALVTSAAQRWRPYLTERGRGLTLDLGDDCRTRLFRRPVEEVLDVLIDHASRHGTGDLVLRTVRTPAYVEVCVNDEGRPAAGSDVDTHTARVTPEVSGATVLATSVGGHLTVGPGPAPSFLLRFPTATRPSERSDHAARR